MIEAVVFDCDGLLLETESLWHVAEADVIARWGSQHTPELKGQLLGTSMATSSALIAAHVGAPADDAPAIGRAVGERYTELLNELGAVPMPGALELVEALHGRLPLAVASNSSRGDVLVALTAAGLIDRFDAICCAGGELAPKPAPDVYLAACAELGSRPERCLAFEDSPTGVAAARAAGLRVVGVPSHPGHVLDADVALETLHGLDLAALGLPAA